jgi:protease IV
MSILKWIWGMLRGFWGFLVGLKNVIVTLLVVGLFIIVMRGVFSSDAAPGVPNGGALKLALDGYIVEQRTEVDPVSALTNPVAATMPSQTLLRDVLEAIDTAAKDSRIKVLTLEMDSFAGGGPAALESIGEALDRFKASGKPIHAHGLYYADDSYYLASRATSISLDPLGGVLLTGYGSYNLYMKDALDKLKINVNVFRVGKYKSAVEPYSRTEMSPEAREEMQALFDVLWAQYKATVERARGRGIALQSLIDNSPAGVQAVQGDLGKYALNSKLVDKLVAREAFVAEMAKLVGAQDDDSGLEDYAHIDMDTYLSATRPRVPGTADKIAVVYAAGEIIDGDHGAGVAGGDTVARLIRQATADEAIKAIVLRIDSPGGSVTASEVIRRAVVEARAAQKPVVASMATLAASGGYWIATGADEILAQPTTITGSIGIFGMVPTFEKTAAWVGVKPDGVGTTILSASSDITQAISPAVRTLMQSVTENGYAQFISRVSEARKLSPERVNDIAQGRVWAGATAHQLKLVDRFGDLEDALAAAAKRAKLKTWQVDYREEPESTQMKLLRYFTDSEAGQVKASPAPQGLALLPVADQLRRASQMLNGKSLRDRNNLFAYCAECSSMAPPNLSRTRVALAQTLMQQ